MLFKIFVLIPCKELLTDKSSTYNLGVNKTTELDYDFNVSRFILS